ncbi:MAG: hypothetical protein HQM08_18720 [Candidatus Riflebacteria bacterium]|nr:hypothetical protein [Candidatus Riflebacteria bacterium]
MRKYCVLALVLCLFATSGFSQTASSSSPSPSVVASDELQKVLAESLKPNTSFGEPMSFNGITIIPVVSRGFAFGMGVGQKSEESKRTEKKDMENNKQEEGERSICGGLGFIRPVSVIVINKEGEIKIQNLQSSLLIDVLEKVSPLIKDFIEKRFQSKVNPPLK